MKTFLVYIRIHSIPTGEIEFYVLKVSTDNIYRVIGKIYYTLRENIETIDFCLWKESKEQFWSKGGQKIYDYREPKLFYD